jgi:hypothetical protein
METFYCQGLFWKALYFCSSATNGGIFAWTYPGMKNKGFEITVTRCCGGENLRSSSGEIRKFRCMPI